LPYLFYAWPSAIAAYRTDKFQGWVTPVLADDILQGLLNWYSLANLQPITAATQSTTPQVTATTPVTTAAPDYTWYLVGIVIIAAVVIVAVATRRKKQR
jgi:hypothetical protein